MILEDEILKLETRREIYNFILEYPGLHLREISRRTNIPLGSLGYYIKSLKKYGLIETKKDQKYKRYYIKHSIGKNDKVIINLLRQETILRIVIILLCPGPGNIYKDRETYLKSLKKYKTWEYTYSKKELAELTKHWRKSDHFHLDKHRTTILFHLKKLIEANLVEEVKNGKESKYKLKDEDMVIAFLIKYKDALSKKAVNEMLEWKRNEYILGLNKLEKIFWEVFPHPYYG